MPYHCREFPALKGSCHPCRERSERFGRLEAVFIHTIVAKYSVTKYMDPLKYLDPIHVTKCINSV